jgi:hypothetical protein
MDNEEMPPSFKHIALPDPSSYFRLLRISKCVENQSVVCELSTWAMDAAPPYVAMSYTWGDPQSTTQIHINGQLMSVRQNCDEVLRQAYGFRPKAYFWIDAICIDQESDHEKNHQVGMMGEIYGRATDVIAGVGLHSDELMVLLDFVRRHRQLVKLLLDHKPRTSIPDDGHYHSPLRMKERYILELYFTFRSPKVQKVRDALCTILERPYFSRLWVLQELYSAKRAWLCCGQMIETFATLHALDMLVDLSRWERGRYFRTVIHYLKRRYLDHIWIRENKFSVATMSYLDRLFEHPLSWFPDDKRRYWSHHEHRYCLTLACNKVEGRTSLYAVIMASKSFACADVRDHLYGVLSLVDWQGGPAPIPNYSKDSFEILKEVVRISPRPLPSGIEFYVGTLLQVFEITNENLFLQKAIESRHRLTKTPTSLEQQRHDSGGSIHRSLQVRAYDVAHPTCPFDDDDQFDQQLWILQGEPNDTFVKLVDKHGKLCAYATLDTREGDWYVAEIDHDTGIILRTSESVRHSLVGIAVWAVDRSCAADLLQMFYYGAKGVQRFEIWWGTEDLIVLTWLYQNARSQQDVLLNTRICGAEGSSYATDWVNNE